MIDKSKKSKKSIKKSKKSTKKSQELQKSQESQKSQENKRKIWDIWKYEFDMNLPKKEFFQNSIDKLKKLKKEELDVLAYYKGIGYYMINKILNTKTLPYIALYNKSHNFIFDNKIKVNKIKSGKHDTDNTKIQYIFPDDIKKIKDKYIENDINFINMFDNIYKKMISLPDIVLYRGIKIPKKYKKHNLSNSNKFIDLTQIEYNKKIEYKKGDIIKNDAYISTTLNPIVALNFSGKDIFFRIKVNKKDQIPFIFLTNKLFSDKGTKKEYLKSLKEWDNTFTDEFEILLPRDVSFKVIKKSHLKIKKKLKGFKDIYSEQYNNILLYEVETMPYVFPEKITKSYFKETSKFVCF